MPTKAAFFDVDGTLTTQRVWRGLLEYFQRNGLRRWTHRIFWLYHTPLFLLHKAHIISQTSFRKPWAAHLSWYIRGYTVEQAQAIWDWVAKDYLQPFWRQDAMTLIQKHKAAGDLVVLVSAGLSPLQEAIAAEVGADLAIGTLPQQHDGRYTGCLGGPVCIDEQKATLPKDMLKAAGYDIDYAASSAYADAATDLDMLAMVGHPTAFHPDETLRPLATQRGWPVVE